MQAVKIWEVVGTHDCFAAKLMQLECREQSWVVGTLNTSTPTYTQAVGIKNLWAQVGELAHNEPPGGISTTFFRMLSLYFTAGFNWGGARPKVPREVQKSAEAGMNTQPGFPLDL